MKNYLFARWAKMSATATIVIAIALSGCKDDGNEPNPPPENNSIVGKWQRIAQARGDINYQPVEELIWEPVEDGNYRVYLPDSTYGSVNSSGNINTVTDWHYYTTGDSLVYKNIILPDTVLKALRLRIHKYELSEKGDTLTIYLIYGIVEDIYPPRHTNFKFKRVGGAK